MYCVNRRFPSGSTLRAESQTGYVFALSVGDNCVATASQDRAIRLLDLSSFGLVHEIACAHDQTITDLQAVPSSVSGAASGAVFMSASHDGTVKVWDLRGASTAMQTIRLSNNTVDAPMFGIAIHGRQCAASCGSNISLFEFGEWKKNFEYTECHYETISCLNFFENFLISGGEDGLVNVLNPNDLVNEDNGQAPVLTINSGDCVRSFGTHGKKIHVFSTSESVSSWDLNSGQELTNYSVRMHPLLAPMDADGQCESYGYIVGLNGDRVVAGNSNGKLIELVDHDTLGTVFDSNECHQSIVRQCVVANNKLITAGEDGLILEWAASGPNLDTNSFSSRRKMHVNSMPY